MAFLGWLFRKRYKTMNGLRVYNWENILRQYYKPTYTKVSECSSVDLCGHFLYPKGIGSSLEYVILDMIADGINKSVLHKCGFHEMKDAFILKSDTYGKFMSKTIYDVNTMTRDLLTFKMNLNDNVYDVRFIDKSQFDDYENIFMDKDPDNPSNRAILIEISY